METSRYCHFNRIRLMNRLLIWRSPSWKRRAFLRINSDSSLKARSCSNSSLGVHWIGEMTKRWNPTNCRVGRWSIWSSLWEEASCNSICLCSILVLLSCWTHLWSKSESYPLPQRIHSIVLGLGQYWFCHLYSTCWRWIARPIWTAPSFPNHPLLIHRLRYFGT